MGALKVTEFDVADTLTGDEIFGFIQGAANVQGNLDDLAAYIVAFVTGGGATLELIRDTIGDALVAGTGITITIDDGADTITIASSITQYTDEMSRDAIGTALVAATGANGGIVITVDDAGNTITVGLASSAFQALTDGANIAWDMSLGYNAAVTLGGNRTLSAPSNPVEGRTYSLAIKQDGTGSRTLALPASFKFGNVGAPTLSTGAAKEDMIFIQCRDSSTPVFKCTFWKDA